LDVFAGKLRQIMRLPPNASVAKRLLAKTMTGEQYTQVWSYYQTLLAQLSRPNITPEVPDGPTPTHEALPEPAQPTPDEPPVSFVEPSCAPEAPTGAAGPGQPAQSAAIYATREEIAALKRLAAQVGPEAAEDLQDVLDHAPKGLMPDLYRRIEARLQARLNSTKTAAVA
jgi:hypothetical protein